MIFSLNLFIFYFSFSNLAFCTIINFFFHFFFIFIVLFFHFQFCFPLLHMEAFANRLFQKQCSSLCSSFNYLYLSLFHTLFSLIQSCLPNTSTKKQKPKLPPLIYRRHIKSHWHEGKL